MLSAMNHRILIAFALSTLPVFAQEVHPDRSVTFTYTGPPMRGKCLFRETSANEVR